MNIRAYISIILLCLSLSGTVIGQGTGGPVLSSSPSKFRFEFDAGVAVPEFARFKFGDVRDAFPVTGGQIIEEVFNERPYSSSYYLGARGSYGLSRCVWWTPSEIYGRFGTYNANHRSSFSEHLPNGVEFEPVIYVPYIDGIIRPTLAGGAVVALFQDSDLQLRRKLVSYEIEAGIRNRYYYRCLSLLPGLFFTYYRMQQRDFLETFNSIDPTKMKMLSHLNSNNYVLGGNFHFEIPLYKFIWLGTVSAGAEYSSASYKGEQRFAGNVFNTPAEELALVSNNKRKWGSAFGGETGLRLACLYGISISVLGNVHYTHVMPYVEYPVPIINTPAVTGPAKIQFQTQLTYGGEVNLSVMF